MSRKSWVNKRFRSIDEPSEAPNRAVPLLFSVKETAELLSLSHRTVWRMIESGEVAVVRIGRAIRIPGDAIEKFIEQRRTK